jgi:hypothetical protein
MAFFSTLESKIQLAGTRRLPIDVKGPVVISIFNNPPAMPVVYDSKNGVAMLL